VVVKAAVGNEKHAERDQDPHEESASPRIVIVADRIKQPPPRQLLGMPPAGDEPETARQNKAQAADELPIGEARQVIRRRRGKERRR
jgi:hypothetical protein